MDETQSEEGFSLVETLVAIVIVTVALFALTAELGAYIKHQASDKARTTAVRIMTSSVETARRLPPSTLTSLATTCASTCVTLPTLTHGRAYTTSETVQKCSLSDPIGTCTAPLSAAVTDTRVTVTVTWSDGTQTHSVTSSTSVADSTRTTYRADSSGTLSTLVGGAAQTATTVTVNAFTAAPTSTTVSTAGLPASAITLSLTTVGLTTATTSIPVTWSDDNGSHQWALTGGPTSWTATIPASSITKAVTGAPAVLTFAATVPGSRALVTAAVTLKQGVDLSSCTVSPATVLLQVLTRKTATAETLTCTSSGLVSTDSVKVAYASGSGTATGTLTSTNGTTWTLVLPSGTSMANGLGLTETFTFTATRAADSVTAVKAVTAVMA